MCLSETEAQLPVELKSQLPAALFSLDLLEVTRLIKDVCCRFDSLVHGHIYFRMLNQQLHQAAKRLTSSGREPLSLQAPLDIGLCLLHGAASSFRGSVSSARSSLLSCDFFRGIHYRSFSDWRRTLALC